MPLNKESKDSAAYLVGNPGKYQRCNLCVFFQPELELPDGKGTCKRVSGVIHPAAWCANWRKNEKVDQARQIDD